MIKKIVEICLDLVRRKTKTYLDLLVNLAVLLVFTLNIYIFKHVDVINLLQTGPNFFLLKFVDENYLRYVVGGVLFFVEALVVILIINSFYQKPISELNTSINDFISGKSKGKNISINTNYLNPNVNFVLKFFNVVLNSLKNIKEEFLSGRAVKSEVQLAAELQEKLLNKKLETIPSLDLIAKSKPAGEVGGDSYDVIKERDNYYIYVGDATGHGVGAGFIMVMVNALISGFAKIFKSGSQILSYTNEILKPRTKSNILMTVLMVRWNEAEKRFYITGAGHGYLIVYKHSQNKCFLVKSGGIALGITKDIHKILKEQEVKFEINDIAVLYTDGITEAINQSKKDGNEQMFGEQRLKEAIEKAPVIPGTNIKTARSVFNNITIELSKFMGYKHTQLDDMTLIVIHYKGGQEIINDFSEEIPEAFITEWNWNK